MTNSTTLCIEPKVGTRKYRMIPRTKKMTYVVLRPMKSDIEAQKMRPPMLKMLIKPTNPAAATAVTPNISWIISDA